jgi:hypothetical protein
MQHQPVRPGDAAAFDHELATVERKRSPPLPQRADVPGIRHRLPEVLGAGQPVTARAKLPAPVPVQLLCQLVRPVDAHPAVSHRPVLRSLHAAQRRPPQNIRYCRIDAALPGGLAFGGPSTAAARVSR